MKLVITMFIEVDDKEYREDGRRATCQDVYEDVVADAEGSSLEGYGRILCSDYLIVEE